MSHVTALKIQIRDLQALALACQRLGLKLNANQRTYKWYGHFVGDYREQGVDPAEMGKCDHAISVVGNSKAYEIGVAARKDNPGIYELRYDFWGGGYGLEAIAGSRCSRLIEEYTKIVAVKEAMRIAEAKGYTVSTHEDRQTGDLVITLSGGGEDRRILVSKPKLPLPKQLPRQVQISPAILQQVQQKQIQQASLDTNTETVQLKVEGVKGESCKELTKILEDAMGLAESSENTHEFYAQTEEHQNRAEETNGN